jgi:hypothetical protein
LRPGIGYWVKFASSRIINLSGTVLAHDTIELNVGWNMIGSISSPVPKTAIASIPGGLALSRFFGYNGAYYATDTIKPGQGYWVKSAQSGKIILSSPGSSVPSNAIRTESLAELPPAAPRESMGDHAVPSAFGLDQNYPNPFNPLTIVRYELPERTHVSLKVFDLLGREVATLVDEVLDAGEHLVAWQVGSLASGMYVCQVKAGVRIATRKMILMK